MYYKKPYLSFNFWFNTIIRLICAFLFSFGIIYTSMFCQSFGFPSENEIQYKIGIFKTYKKNAGGGRGGPNIVTSIALVSDKGQITDFDCSYSALEQPTYCFSAEQLANYRNQQAKIGYYHQKDFLWFSNKLPQIASLEINGKQIQSYQETKQKIKDTNKNNLLFMLIVDAILIGLWLFSDYAIRKF